jgi:hypothetical protein
VLREVSPTTFSVSIETEATFLLVQLGLVGRAMVFSMSASCSSATRPTLEAERRNIFAQLLVSERLDKRVRGRIEPEAGVARPHHIVNRRHELIPPPSIISMVYRADQR